MTDRQPHLQIVQTNAGWHTRLRGANGEPVTATEVYTEPTTAEHAVVVMAKAFAIDLDEPRRHAAEFGGGWVSGRTRHGDVVHVSIEWIDERQVDADEVVEFAEQPSPDAMRHLRHVHVAGRCVKRSAGPHCEVTR